MPRFVVEIDSSEWQEAVGRLMQATDDFSELMAGNIADAVQGMVADAFQEQGRPGEPWPELSDKTLARRRKGKKASNSDRILQDTGRLKQSVSVGQAGSHSYEVGSNILYARVHQFGAVIRRKTREAKNAERLLERAKKGRKYSDHVLELASQQAKERGGILTVIPARPYLPMPMTEDERGELADALVHYLKTHLEG
jgi:phage virion morphogenesis protein